MPDIDKRLRYFTGQFLQEQDFTDEQAYHVDRQRRHNRDLHTPGIAEGLDVEAAEGATQAVVRPGTALDGEGRQIVLSDSKTLPLNAPELQGKTLFVVISYHDEPTDVATVGKPEATRIYEIPDIRAFPVDAPDLPSDRTHIRLARLTISDTGTITNPDPSVRVRAGVSIGDQLELNELRLRRAGDTRNQWPVLSSNARGNLNITGNLSVNGQNFRSGWVRLPFLPKPNAAMTNRPAFSLSVFRATSGSAGAAGSIEIPIPPGITRITRLRIAGNRNVGGIAVNLWRITVSANNLTTNRLLTQNLTVSGNNPFNDLFSIASGNQPLNAETQAIALDVESQGESEIWFVAAEFA